MPRKTYTYLFCLYIYFAYLLISRFFFSTMSPSVAYVHVYIHTYIYIYIYIRIYIYIYKYIYIYIYIYMYIHEIHIYGYTHIYLHIYWSGDTNANIFISHIWLFCDIQILFCVCIYFAYIWINYFNNLYCINAYLSRNIYTCILVSRYIHTHTFIDSNIHINKIKNWSRTETANLASVRLDHSLLLIFGYLLFITYHC